MAAALVASVLEGSSDAGFSVTSTAIDTTGANLIYIAVSRWTGGSLAAVNPITDSYGNTWTALTGESSTGGADVSHFYCIDPVVGGGHTFTATSTVSSNTYPTIAVLAFSGASGGLVDETGLASNGNATSLNSGTVTPVSDGCVVVSVLSVLTLVTGINVSGGSLSIVDVVDYVNGQHQGMAVAYEIQTTATARQASWSWTNSVDSSSIIIAFDEGLSPIRCSTIFGENGTVTSSRTFLANLDAVTRTVDIPNAMVLGGTFVVFESGSAPIGIANAARIYAEDNGSGKTQLMVVFGTGSPVQIAIEP